MRKVLIVSIIWITGLIAYTYNNPGNGGVDDGYLMKDERAVNGYIADGGSNYSGQAGANLDSLFVTWDDNYLYILLTTNNTENWDVAYGFGIDNTGSSSGYTGSGGSPSDAWGRHIGFDNGYNVEYQIYFWWSSSDQAITSAQLCSWDGSNWSYTDLTSGTDYVYQGGASGLQSIEIKIARSDIGNPSNIAVSAWVAGGDNSSAVDAVPSEDDVADGDFTDNDYISQMYAHDISSGRTPNWFIVLDGTLSREGYQTDEQFYTTSSQNAYITWDADSLYVGYIFQNLSGDPDYDLCIYFDTDPQKTKNFGEGIDIDANIAVTLPFNADYAVHILDRSKGVSLKYFDGNDWVDGTFHGHFYAGWSGNGTNEISIPWSDIGNPDTFYMVIYSYNNSDSKAYGIAPNTGNTDGTDEIGNFVGIFRKVSGFSPSEHIGDTNHIMEIYSDGESGSGTLRDAIETANGDADRDTVIFRTDATITLNSDFPKIVNDIFISGGTNSVTIDGNSKAHDGFRVSTDSLYAPLHFVGIENITVQNALSAILISVGNGAPIDTVLANSFYVDACKNGIYTGLVGDAGLNGAAYDNATVYVTEAYMTNLDDYGIYARTATSGKQVKVVVDGSYIETAGDDANEAGIAALDNVILKTTGWTELRGNYYGLLLWNTTSAEAQYDTIQNTKIDTSFYSGIVIKREGGSMTLNISGDSIFSNGSFGDSDGGVVISAFSGGADELVDLKLLSSTIYDDATYQEYGVVVTDWVSTGDSATGVQIGDANSGNEIMFNTNNGIHILTDRARGMKILYNNIHDNGQNGIYIAQADSVLIEQDTITGHSASGSYGVYIDGTAKSNSDYNKITQCYFENNNRGIGLANGANEGIITPQITRAALTTLSNDTIITVHGTNGASNGTVEAYTADGYNGKIYLGSSTVNADGTWTVEAHHVGDIVSENTPITALTTTTNGSSSEFAAPVGATSVQEPGNTDPVAVPAFSVSTLHGDRDIKVELSLPRRTTLTVEFFDVAGRLLKAREAEFGAGHHTLSFRLSHNGIYFVRIMERNNILWVKKIVIVR